MNTQKKLQTEHFKHRIKIGACQSRDNRNHRNKIAAINDYLNIKPHSKVLEIGVGTGIHASYLLNWNQDKHLIFTGVDLSIDMLHLSSDKLGEYKNASLSTMDSECLAFRDNTFDAAYISGSLHHFHDCLKAISEMIRCIKPNSKFVIMEPNWAFPNNFIASKTITAEKNISLMKKSNFHKWLSTFPEVKYAIKNFAYTPPFPRSFINFYDQIDLFLAKIPFVRNMSNMIFIMGQKMR